MLLDMGGIYMLLLRNLSVRFDNTIFEDASFVAPANSLVTITGKSGSGKTTLLKCIMQQVKGTTGVLQYNDIVINHDNIDAFLFEKVSYIDQMGSYLHNMTILQHFTFYAKLHNIKIDKEDVLKYLQMVELHDILLHKYPTYLSTGQRKRMLIAIALMLQKEILIIDEPTASLDQDSQETILCILKKITKKGHVTCICTTHDKNIVAIADIKYYIKNQQLVSTDTKKETRETKGIMHQKIPRLGYVKYKNKKGMFLFLVILILGCMMVNIVPKTIAKQASVYNKNTETSNQNIGLIVKKKMDARYTEIGQSFSANTDFIDDEEISWLKKQNGVSEVLPYYELMGGNSKHDTFKVYRDSQCVDEISFVKLDESYNIPYRHTTYITPYYEQQNIRKNGEKLHGIYINEAFARLLNTTDFQDLYIETHVNIPIGYVKNNEGQETIYGEKEILSSMSDLPQLVPIEKKVTLKLKIEGVLPTSTYNDGYYEYDARIYMPVNQLEEIIQNHFDESMFTTTAGELHKVSPKAMLILCQSGKEEEVKIAIEEQNALFNATNSNLAMLSTIHAIQEANSRSQVISILLCLLTMITVLFVSIYTTWQHKKEATILCQEGLSKQLPSYFIQDFIMMSSIWLMVSFISLYIFYNENMQSAIPLYDGSTMVIWWIGSVCVCIAVLIISNVVCIKRIVRL